MEAETETPPKKKGQVRIFVVRKETVDNIIKACGEAVEAKHLFKLRLSVESSHLETVEKHKNNILKRIENASGRYPVLKKFNVKYMKDVQNSILLQQSLVSKLGEADGPYEMIKQWLDAPNTKNKPEELKKQLSAFYEEHRSKVKQLRKEMKTLRAIRDYLESCQEKLRIINAALRTEFERSMHVPAAHMREKNSLKGKEQELLSRQNKSLQTFRELLAEETEIRERMQKGMAQILTEIHKFDEERVQAINDATNKFASILNHQEMYRSEKKSATLDLLAEVTPGLIDLPIAEPISSENTRCILYKIPDFAERLKEMGFSSETSASVVNPDGNPNENTETEPSSSKDTENDSTKPSTSKDTGNGSTKPSSSKDTEHSSLKPTADQSDEKEENKVAPQLVEDEEKPKRRPPKPPKKDYSGIENDKPPSGPNQAWASSEDLKDEEPNEQDVDHGNGPEIEHIHVPELDDNPTSPYGTPLEEPFSRVALMYVKATESTYLSFKKGQKLVQTHKVNNEGLVYGYTRKHAYSQVKYGYFLENQTSPWRSTRKNIVKNLFRQI